jgi:hypothetical protein
VRAAVDTEERRSSSFSSQRKMLVEKSKPMSVSNRQIEAAAILARLLNLVRDENRFDSAPRDEEPAEWVAINRGDRVEVYCK